MKKLLKITFTLLFTTIILLGFAMPLNPVGNWYQQFLPTGLPNFQVSDITFLDSLTGFAVTGNGTPNDSSGYILKTIDGGNNWSLKFAEFRDFSRVKFINANTGFVSGGYFNGARIYKTTNAGENWFQIGIPEGGQIYFNDMTVLNGDTLWVVANNNLVGGIFRTTNGGVNWQSQGNFGSSNPSHVYMYNARIGFIDGLKKTTNGGLNWINQVLPSGGIILDNSMIRFSNLGSDTIWGTGGLAFYGAGQFRGIIYRTINGGTNWLFQVPDTAIHSGTYQHIQFVNKNNGWAYWPVGGVHTTSGGDLVWLTGITQISTQIPKEYKLFQNYPNPFNPTTNIKYNVKSETSNVKLIIFDILGKQIAELVNQKQNAGTYQVNWDASDYPSGVYFYRIVTDEFSESKKMVLVK